MRNIGVANTVCSRWKLGSDCRVGTRVIAFVLSNISFKGFFSEKVGKIIIETDFLNETDDIISCSIEDLLVRKAAISGFDQIAKAIMLSQKEDLKSC